jgi:hypothetical protein
MGKPNFAPLHSVFVLPDEKIVFSSGLPYLPDGNDSWKLHHLWDLGVLDKDDASIYSIWGTSLNNLYFAGNKGTIVHFNGNNWRKIESGTEEDLYEIYGDEKSIYVGGGSYMNSTGVLLKGDKTGFDIIKEGTYEYVDTVFEPYFVGSLSTLWLTPKGTLYFGGDALYKNKYNNWDFDRTLEGNCLRCDGGGRYYSSITKIRGNADNDMVLVGLTNTVRHFNGVSWKQLGEEYEPNLSILFWWYSVSMKNNEIIAVGEIGSKAIIRRFKR